MNNEMSVVLGTVAMEPKGEYNSSTYYDKLNTVTYEGFSYMAKQPCQNILPTNTDYWQKISGGIAPSDIVDNLDSTATNQPLSANQGKVLNNTRTMIFDTVALMKASTSLKNGMTVQTLGYYAANDGGGATYKITNIANANVHQESLSNSLYATLILENNTINIRQIGARPQDTENNKYDIKSYVDLYVSYLNNNSGLKLYIPSGIWYTSAITITKDSGFYIYGDETFNIDDKSKPTTLVSLNDNQTHIMQIGDSTHKVQGWVLKNICFGSRDFTYNNGKYERASYKKITDACLVLVYAVFGITENLFFDWIDGTALRMSSCWENYFDILNFRHINGFTNGIVIFDDVVDSEQNENISASNFNKLMFEAVTGDLIVAKEGCNMSNCSINNLNFEDWAYSYTGYDYTTITTETDDDFNHWAIFKVYGKFIINVNNLELNNFGYRYLTYNENNYCHDTIINVAQNGANPNMIFNNINIAGMNMDCPIIRQNNYYMFTKSNLCVDNVNLHKTTKSLYFYVTGAKRLKCNANTLSGAPEFTTYQAEDYNSVIPCYKSVDNKNENSYGSFYYDKDTKNKLHIAVKPYNVATEGEDGDVRTPLIKDVVTGKNLLLRAKFEENESVTLKCFFEDGTTRDLTFAGTGQYETYTKTNIDEFVIGKVVMIRLATGQAEKDCYLDYYKFY